MPPMASHSLRIKSPDGTSREVSLEGELTVGRSVQGNGLVLEEGGVSRKHARFFVAADGKLHVEDLGSAHGTFVDGEKIAAPRALVSGARVQLGDYELTVEGGAPRTASSTGAKRAPGRTAGVSSPAGASRKPAPGPTGTAPAAAPRAGSASLARRPRAAGAPAAPASGLARRAPSTLASTRAPPPGPFPSICGVEAPWSSRRINLRPGINLVGRQELGGIFIDDESLSRQHAELEVAADGIFVRDLLSANGTALNEEAVGEQQVPLKSGDVLQFGAVRFSFDAGDVEALAAPTRRGAAGSSGGRRGPSAAAGGGAKRSSWGLVGAVAAALVLVVVGVAVVHPTGVGKGRAKTLKTGTPSAVDQKARLQQLISQCRSYSMVEFGSDPDWKKADAACNAALDIDPIHPEALELKKKIKFESEAWVLFEKGSKALSRQREEEALDQFARIPRESAYFNRVKQIATDPIKEVKRTTLNDCKRYSANGRWKQALGRCETYMALVCQEMPREELYPPIGMKITLSSRPKSDEWRPADLNYRRFLAARAKVEPSAAEWRCPEIPLFSGARAGPDPKKDVEAELKAKFPDAAVRAAAVRYWEGKAPEAENALQRIISTSRMAAMHDAARDLLADISSVRSLFGNGSSLVKDAFEDSLEPFEEALELDRKIIGEALSESRPSYFRRTIQSDVARASYESGKVFADRDDFKKACHIWKLGFGMYKADLDLLRALQNACTRRAQGILAEAQSCPELQQVVDLAVPGDGLQEQAEEKKKALQCL